VKLFETIPGVPGLTVSYETKFAAICSEGDAPFGGVLTIEYDPEEKLIEYESFEVWLRDLANDSHTIESFTRMILDELVPALGDIVITVKVEATTIVHGPVKVWATHWPGAEQDAELIASLSSK